MKIDELFYTVIDGAVTKCRVHLHNGEIRYLTSPYKKSIYAVTKDLKKEIKLTDYVFRTKEVAQEAILKRKINPIALTWFDFHEDQRPKIYIAGFHVFRPDGVEYGKKLRNLCQQYRFQGLYPRDREPYDNLDKQGKATMIYFANEGLIRKADIVIANLNPFRGHEPDSGTVFECGLAYALGKKVYGFISDNRNMKEKLADKLNVENGMVDGMLIEDFDLPLNLMLSISSNIIAGTFEQCLQQVAEDMNIINATKE
ncbi:nucleoside 2-deoxyribosyltransferase [Gracilibacillus sp. HCP3S3_G5_1]|uniref:nucleoside 2-deoxyribosyltransferase n=1 Tax=unclassified Gracilibacillus TaxID=2625209 RepID=UPI003F8881B2